MDDYDIPRRSSRKANGGGWFLYLIVLAAVGGGIYYFWNNGFDVKTVEKFFTTNELPSGVSDFFKKTPTGVKTFADKSQSFIKSGIDLLTEKPKEAATNVFNDVAKTATESVKKEAAQFLGLSPTSTAPTTIAIPSNISIVRPVRQNLSLLMDTDKEDISYVIDWGDKQTTRGSLIKKESKIIDHLWSEAGEYTVAVDIIGKDTGKKTFAFPVTIQK